MIAVISDVHGNLPALDEVLREIDRLGCARIVCLGDVTGYYAQPGECLERLRGRDTIFLLGNHDKYLVEGTGCPRSRMISSLLVHQRIAVTEEQIRFLSGLSSHYEFGSATFVHGGWKDPLDQYLYSVGVNDLPGEFSFYFCGHTHVQFLHDFGGKRFCNPGSVGQPRDGDHRAAFATLTNEVVQLHRVEYDIDATAEAMRRAGYVDEKLWCNLYSGAQIGGRTDSIEANPARPGDV